MIICSNSNIHFKFINIYSDFVPSITDFLFETIKTAPIITSKYVFRIAFNKNDFDKFYDSFFFYTILNPHQFIR